MTTDKDDIRKMGEALRLIHEVSQRMLRSQALTLTTKSDIQLIEDLSEPYKDYLWTL